MASPVPQVGVSSTSSTSSTPFTPATSTLSSAPPPIIPPSESLPAKWRSLVGCWSRREPEHEEILVLQGDSTFHFVRIIQPGYDHYASTHLTVGTWGPLDERGIIYAKEALSCRGGFGPHLRQLAKPTSRSSGTIKACTEHLPESSISLDATYRQGFDGGPNSTAPPRMVYPFFLSRKDELVEYNNTEVIYTRTRNGHFFGSKTIFDSNRVTTGRFTFRLTHCQDRQQQEHATIECDVETNREENEIEEKEEAKQSNTHSVAHLSYDKMASPGSQIDMSSTSSTLSTSSTPPMPTEEQILSALPTLSNLSIQRILAAAQKLDLNRRSEVAFTEYVNQLDASPLKTMLTAMRFIQFDGNVATYELQEGNRTAVTAASTASADGVLTRPAVRLTAHCTFTCRGVNKYDIECGTDHHWSIHLVPTEAEANDTKELFVLNNNTETNPLDYRFDSQSLREWLSQCGVIQSEGVITEVSEDDVHQLVLFIHALFTPATAAKFKRGDGHCRGCSLKDSFYCLEEVICMCS